MIGLRSAAGNPNNSPEVKAVDVPLELVPLRSDISPYESPGPNLRTFMAASATIAKEKTSDRSIDTMCLAAYRDFLKELNHSASDG